MLKATQDRHALGTFTDGYTGTAGEIFATQLSLTRAEVQKPENVRVTDPPYVRCGAHRLDLPSYRYRYRYR